MTDCFLCNQEISKSEKKHGVFELGKDGIVIPMGMTARDIICNECYHKEKAQYEKSSIQVGKNVSEVSFHDKELSPEEVKELFEKSRPPSFEDKEPHLVSHKDEDEGYLWIDGKKVKKDNSMDSK